MVVHRPELFLRFDFAVPGIAVGVAACCLLGYAIAKRSARLWPAIVLLLLGAGWLLSISVVLR